MDVVMCLKCRIFFLFKQNAAYELRISDWSSDVCSSDLAWTIHPCDRRPSMTEPSSSSTSSHQSLRPRALSVPGRPYRGDCPTLACSMTSFALRQSSAQRRVGQEGVSTGRSRWAAFHDKQMAEDQITTLMIIQSHK